VEGRVKLIPEVGHLVAWRLTPPRMRELAKMRPPNIHFIINCNAGLKKDYTYDNFLTRTKYRLQIGADVPGFVKELLTDDSREREHTRTQYKRWNRRRLVALARK